MVLLHMHNVTVAMDARMLGKGGTGVSTYARSLRSVLPLLSTRPTILEDGGSAATPFARGRRLAAALSPRPRAARLLPQSPGGSGLFVPDVFRLSQVYFNVHRRLLPITVPGQPGIMHWTYPVPIQLVGWKNLYTVHDVIPLTDPSLSEIDPVRHRRLLDRIVEAAAALVTVSSTAAAAIRTTLGCLPSFVVDCSQPIDVPDRTVGPPPAGLEPGYLLVCGSVEPRKNIARLLAAWRQSGTALPLVIAGPDGWRSAEFKRDIEATAGVIRLGYVSRDDLLSLIGHARALLMPSLAEGFGLPVAEAMALGTPVLTSSGSALEEIAGGAALLVDPYNIEAMASAIGRLATDDALCAELAARGRLQALRFTRQAFAARLSTLYAGLIAQPG